MDPHSFIKAVSHKDVIDKLCRALGSFIKLTISDVIKSINAKFDSTVDAIRQTIDFLTLDLTKRYK